MNTNITMENLSQFEQAFDQNPVNAVAMNAVTANGINACAQNYQIPRKDVHEFSVSLKQGKVTNQKKSGRCWMFAALNCLRFSVMKKLNLDTFELSQSYTLFYDKLEKSNYFLESILETLDEPTEGRLIAHLLSAPLNDGGQWDMLCNLVDKYGLVPKTAMPETAVSSATQEMNGYMTEKLREFACQLRKAHKEGASMEQLRANGIFDLRQVEFVLAETNGQLSIVKKAPFEPLSPKSAGIQVENTPPPVLVVDDRKVIEEGLKLCKMSEQELKKLLKKAGYRLEDVFLMTCTPQKDYYIVPLDPKERSN